MIYLSNLIQIELKRIDYSEKFRYNYRYKDLCGEKMSNDILSKLIITKIYSAATMFTPENVNMVRKNRSNWAIIMKYEGETLYTSGGERWISNENNIALLPRGSNYEWHCISSGSFCFVEFECELEYPKPFIFSVKNSEKILKMMKELEYKRNLRNDFAQIESIRDTYSVFLELLRQSESNKYLPKSKEAKLTTATEYISKHYNESLTNDFLAAISGISTVYFRKLFTAAYGMSPMSYVHKLRIEKAKEMLRGDFGTVSDISSSLGYSSLYDFSRDFKKRVGKSPSKYILEKLQTENIKCK